jgi:hypothetical protein
VELLIQYNQQYLNLLVEDRQALLLAAAAVVVVVVEVY